MVFISVQLIIGITNLILMKRLDKFPKSNKHPKVSILLPARDEEKTIENCVNSLIEQDYDNLEIIVLNDNSVDRTDEILNSIKSERLRVIVGKPLPETWLGKSWACHQLALEASGDLFLFTDADTIYQPDTISKAVNAMEKEKTDLITAVNHNQVKSFGEQITIPFIVYSIFTILPLLVAYLFPKSKSFSAANGKFMLFRKEFYQKIGGHQTIKESAIEDVELARITKANGGKWRLFDVSNLITSRMYYGFSDCLQGFTKNYFALFGYKILVALFVWCWVGLITFYPLVVVIGSIITRGYNRGFVFAGVAIIETCVLWILTSIKFRFPWHQFLLYPITVLVSIFIGLRSMILTIVNKTSWKGRKLKSAPIRWI